MRVEHNGYAIESSPQNPRSYVIKNVTKGGSLPLVFDGVFTDIEYAKRTIEAYIGRSNAKAGAKS